jgi:hypothetical protein
MKGMFVNPLRASGSFCMLGRSEVMVMIANTRTFPSPAASSAVAMPRWPEPVVSGSQLDTVALAERYMR